jgi:hypothetical protein
MKIDLNICIMNKMAWLFATSFKISFEAFYSRGPSSNGWKLYLFLVIHTIVRHYMDYRDNYMYTPLGLIVALDVPFSLNNL